MLTNENDNNMSNNTQEVNDQGMLVCLTHFNTTQLKPLMPLNLMKILKIQ